MKKNEVTPRAYKTPLASQYLGLSRRGLLDLVDQGRMPCIKAGARSFLFDVKDLDAFMDAHKIGGEVL
jgi:excisionase family DNA binding protein